MSLAEEGASERRPGDTESPALGSCEWEFGSCTGDGLGKG